MILVINAGSSNVKFALYTADTLKQMHRGQVNTMQDMYAWLLVQKDQYNLSGIGHRIVHGGSKFSAPIVLNAALMQELKQYIPLAPLHQPHNLAAIEFLMQQFPQVKQVGCFDTAFHTTQLPLAKQFAIPADLTAAGIIRYGFHGLSYEYIASILPGKIGQNLSQKVIVAHLGNGASMCAMQDLTSVATSMGFSALDGLMMGTRCGNIDPGVLLYLLQEKGLNSAQLASFLYNNCGLLGVSNLSNDMRQLLDNDSAAAQFAVDLFCYRAACEFGKLLVPLQGCQSLVFTGGIGENAAPIRAGICKWLAWLGVVLDAKANAQNYTIVSDASSKVVAAVVPTDEELIIARHVKGLLG